MNLIKLSQPSCQPCKLVGQFLDEQKVEYEEIDVTERPDIAVKYGVMGVPATILLDDEENEVDRVVGFDTEKLQAMIEQL